MIIFISLHFLVHLYDLRVIYTNRMGMSSVFCCFLLVITMAKSTISNISIRMDSDLKAAAEALYEELGMNLSTAFNILVRQSLRERGIPFKITEMSIR